MTYEEARKFAKGNIEDRFALYPNMRNVDIYDHLCEDIFWTTEYETIKEKYPMHEVIQKLLDIKMDYIEKLKQSIAHEESRIKNKIYKMDLEVDVSFLELKYSILEDLSKIEKENIKDWEYALKNMYRNENSRNIPPANMIKCIEHMGIDRFLYTTFSDFLGIKYDPYVFISSIELEYDKYKSTKL